MKLGEFPAIVEIFQSKGERFSEATLRKYVQLNLLPNLGESAHVESIRVPVASIRYPLSTHQ